MAACLLPARCDAATHTDRAESERPPWPRRVTLVFPVPCCARIKAQPDNLQVVSRKIWGWAYWQEFRIARPRLDAYVHTCAVLILCGGTKLRVLTLLFFCFLFCWDAYWLVLSRLQRSTSPLVFAFRSARQNLLATVSTDNRFLLDFWRGRGSTSI